METSQVNRIMVEVARMSGVAKEVHDLLSAQQNVLKMRDIELDPELLAQLQDAYQDMNGLRMRLAEQQPELAQLRALVRTMTAINSTLDLNQILNDVMDTFIELTEAERGLVVLLDPDTQEIQIQTIRGMDEEALNKSTFVVSRTVVADVAQSGETVITTNALEDDRYSAEESIIGYAPRSIICVPLKVKNTVIGVAYSDHRLRAELFGDQERKFLEAFGNQAAIAIENARLYDDVQRRLAQISEIRNFLDNIFSSIVSGIITLSTDGVVISTNRAAEAILGVDEGGIKDHHYSEVIPGLYEGFDETLGAVMQDGAQQMVEVNPVLPARGPVFLKLKFSPLIDAESQRLIGVAIVIDDLTEFKKHEETINVVNTYLSEEMVQQIEDLDNLGLGGESREISAIFADVRGFTSFSEDLEPEELMTVINQYLSVSSDAITVSDGIIDKFMGDAVLGLFNTQLNPQKDHAVRCVAAAVMMQRDVQELHTGLPAEQRLRYGIGIHTGPVTIGNIGSPSRKEFTAIGEAVDFAKKLQECAQGGEIVISPQTYALVKHRLECEAVERQMRGSDKAVQVYIVKGLA